MFQEKKIRYFLDYDICDFFYGRRHPMKPLRLKILNEILLAYGINYYLCLKNPSPISMKAMTNFHENRYINSLFRDELIDKNTKGIIGSFLKYKDADCPVINGILKYTSIYSGASLACSDGLNSNNNCLGINWSGGFHHAKKSTASGFCYINDIVLLLLELGKKFRKILYVDIDAHHGDGVEEAFYLSDNIFTVSFHKYGTNFFPGSGRNSNNGLLLGGKHSLNIPIFNINNKKNYQNVFETTLERVFNYFEPEIILIQGGSDSLSGDKVGKMNITMSTHSNCIKKLVETNKKFIVLGGGGYNLENVAKCWVYETSMILNKELKNDLPYNKYYKYFKTKSLIDDNNKRNCDKKKPPKYLTKLNKTILYFLDLKYD